MKVLALALDHKVLALGEKSLALARPIQNFSPKTQTTCLLYVYALLTLTVSHDSDSLPFLV